MKHLDIFLLSVALINLFITCTICWEHLFNPSQAHWEDNREVFFMALSWAAINVASVAGMIWRMF